MAGGGALQSISSLDYCHHERMLRAATISSLQNWVRAVRAWMIPDSSGRSNLIKMEAGFSSMMNQKINQKTFRQHDKRL